MHAALAELQQGLAVEGERFCDGAGAVGGVDDVIDDFQPVRVGDLAGAPGAQIGAVAVEHHHRRVLALEDVDAVLRVGGYAADQAEPFSVGEFEEIADHLIGAVACAGLGHCCVPPGQICTNVVGGRAPRCLVSDRQAANRQFRPLDRADLGKAYRGHGAHLLRGYRTALHSANFASVAPPPRTAACRQRHVLHLLTD
jgi:hypothetical protein